MGKSTRIILTIVCILTLVLSICGLTACDKDPVVRQLTIQSTQNGKVEADKEAYIDGETVTLTITKSAGYQLSSIKVNGEEKISNVSADGKTLTFVIDSDTTVSAEFSKIPTYKATVSVTGGGGSVSADKSVYSAGETAKLTITPSSYYQLKSFKVDGVEKKTEIKTDGGKLVYEFSINSNVSVVAEFEKLPPVDAQVTIASAYNLNGMQLTLTPEQGSAKQATVADGKFTIDDAELGMEYAVTGVSRGFTLALGRIIVDGEQIEYNPSITENSGSLDIANGSYVANAELRKGINLNFAEAVTGDAWFVTKIQIAPEDMTALLASNEEDQEAVFGISVKANDQTSVEHVIQLKAKDGANQFVAGCDAGHVWTEGNGRFFTATATATDRTLTELGQALVGDGLYLIFYYEDQTGLTYTYYGTDVNNIVRLRDWGTAEGRSFETGAEITGISLGLVHTSWGREPFAVTFSQVGYGTTLGEALGLDDVVLTDDSTCEHGQVQIQGSMYEDVTLTFVPDEGYGIEAISVNGQLVELNENNALVLENYNSATVKVEATFTDAKYSVTATDDEHSTVAITDKDGNAITDLTQLLSGTIINVTVTLDESYALAYEGFTVNDQPIYALQYTTRVFENIVIEVSSAVPVTIEGALDVGKYASYASGFTVSAGNGTYVGSVVENDGAYKWQISVPSTMTSIQVKVENDFFRPVIIALDDTNATATTVTLVPNLTYTTVFGAYDNPDYQSLSYDVATGSYTISNNNHFGDIASGYKFNGVNSQQWIIETEITNIVAGQWGFYGVGIMIGENDFLMIFDRDDLKKFASADFTGNDFWTFNANQALIGSDKEAVLGYGSGWPTGINKVTVVRDLNDIYIFVGDMFIGRYDVSIYWPSLENNNSTMLGFATFQGCGATFSNWWFTEDAEEVATYISDKVVGKDVQINSNADTLGIEGDVATVKFYVQHADNSWIEATEADLIAGARIKMTVENMVAETYLSTITAVTLNGQSISMGLSGGEYIFSLAKAVDSLSVEIQVDVAIVEVTEWVELSNTLDVTHYEEYVGSLTVSSMGIDGTLQAGENGLYTWTISVPKGSTNFEVTIADPTGRFHNVVMSFESTDVATGAQVLVPKMTKYDLWGDHNGAYVPDQNELVLNADGSYSIKKTESGAALDNDNWWASGVTTGATFAGIDSKYWVLETEIVLDAAGGWNQWHAGITLDQSEFIMIMDRDYQMTAWTEWNITKGEAGGFTDMITNEKATRAGIVSGSNWAPSDKPMKVTVVRDDKTIYVFLNDQYIDKYEISQTLFPNTSRGNSTKIGFMVRSGTEATFSNYWYELGETNVDDYLATKKISAFPSFSATADEGVNTEDIKINFYKQVLTSTDSANGYAETVQWVQAYASDLYAGAYLMAKVTLPEGVTTTDYFINLKLNGKAIANNGVFALAEGDAFTVDVSKEVALTGSSTTFTFGGKGTMKAWNGTALSNWDLGSAYLDKGSVTNSTEQFYDGETSSNKMTITTLGQASGSAKGANGRGSWVGVKGLEYNNLSAGSKITFRVYIDSSTIPEADRENFKLDFFAYNSSNGKAVSVTELDTWVEVTLDRTWFTHNVLAQALTVTNTNELAFCFTVGDANGVKVPQGLVIYFSDFVLVK